MLSNSAAAGPHYLQHQAYDPFTSLFGLPAAAGRVESASELQITLEHNNVFMGGASDESGTSEQLQLDGESSRLSLRYRRPVGDCWALELTGGWVSHSSGWFDRAIDNWHQFFGLPDASRDESPFHQVEYSWRNSGDASASLSLDRATNGFADASISAQRSLNCSASSALARVGIKLPIGDIENWTGSGAVDVFADIQSSWWQPGPQHSLGTTFGVLIPGKVQQIDGQRDLVAFGALAWQWQLPYRIAVGLQLDWHTALLENNLVETGSTAGMLSMNVGYETLHGSRFEFSVFEDVIVDTAPDIAVRFGLTLPL